VKGPLVTIALPPVPARASQAVLRPRDLAEVYAHPRPEVARLVRAGLLVPLARGYYARVPVSARPDPSWRPDLPAAALGVGQADAGAEGAVLMHVSAARLLGALPRDVDVAVVALDRPRAPLPVLGGVVFFVRRDLRGLDVRKVTTLLGPGLITTPEQTLLDLAHRPGLAGVDPALADAAMTALTSVVDWPTAARLAEAQRRRATLMRVAPASVAADLVPTAASVP
jgi:hypothetical protein